MAGKLRLPSDEDEATAAGGNQANPVAGDDDQEDEDSPVEDEDGEVEDEDGEFEDDAGEEDSDEDENENDEEEEYEQDDEEEGDDGGASDDEDDETDSDDDDEFDLNENGADGAEPASAQTAASRVNRMLYKQPLHSMPMCLTTFQSNNVAVGTVDGRVQLYKVVNAPRAAKNSSITSTSVEAKPEVNSSEARALSLEALGVVNLNVEGQKDTFTGNSVRVLCLPYNSGSNKTSSRGSSSKSASVAGLSNSTMLAATKFGYVNWLDLEKTCISHTVNAAEAGCDIFDKAISCVLPLNEHAVAVGFDTGRIVIADRREEKKSGWAAGGVLETDCESIDQIADFLLCGDGHTLLTACGDGHLYSLDIRNRKQLLKSERLAELTSLATIGNGRHVVASSLDGRLYIFNNGEYGAPSDMYGGLNAEIMSIVNYPESDDGNMLLTGDAEGHLRLIHLFPHKQVAYVGRQESVEHMSILPNFEGRTLVFAISETDEDLKVWDCSKLAESLTAAEVVGTVAGYKTEGASTSGGKRRQGNESSDDADSSDDDDNEAGGSGGRRNEHKKSRKMPRVNEGKAKNEEFFADMA